MIRILNLIKRKLNAIRINIKFPRAANFIIPEKIKINNRQIKLSSLNDNGSKTALVEIFLDDCYNIRKLKKEKIKTILDVGGHSGFFSLHCRNIFPDAVIHTYEPNPKMSNIIKANSHSGNFTFFNEAVGSKDGAADLIISNDSVLTKTIEKSNGSITITAFSKCLQRLGGIVDLLKLDCEGAEWEILKDEESFKKVNYITMEYHLINKRNIIDLTNLVQNINFRIILHTKYDEATGVVCANNAIQIN